MKSSLFDVFAGFPKIPFRTHVGVSMQDVAKVMAPDLVQSAWRPSTRTLYQGWLGIWLAFCMACDVLPLPADPDVLVAFMTELALAGRNASTIGVALSAIIGFHRLNNIMNPFYANPIAALAWKGIDKTRNGAQTRPKDGIDPEFIRRMWLHFHALWYKNLLRFRDARAWFCLMLGWEIAARPGELHNLRMCDIVPVRWLGEKFCGDLMVFVRGAKNDYKFAGQVTRVVLPDLAANLCEWCGKVGVLGQRFCGVCASYRATVVATPGVAGDSAIRVPYPFRVCPTPSAAWLWYHMWCPALQHAEFDNRRVCVCTTYGGKVCGCKLLADGCMLSEGARADVLRAHRCDKCNPVLPTRPRNTGTAVSFPSAVSTQTIGEDVRRVARMLGIDDLDLSAKSLRIGGLSAATEDGDGPGMEAVSAEMRWRSKKVPQNVYKRKTAEEQRRTGLALHAAVRARSTQAQMEERDPSLERWLQ